MCIPSQITCNCYSKVFNAFNVFKVSSLQGIWSMDLLDPFSCQLHHIAFDRLKSHTPLPCPWTQSINIPLKFHCVFFILNFTIANTVISKKSYFRLNIWKAVAQKRAVTSKRLESVQFTDLSVIKRLIELPDEFSHKDTHLFKNCVIFVRQQCFVCYHIWSALIDWRDKFSPVIFKKEHSNK